MAEMKGEPFAARTLPEEDITFTYPSDGATFLPVTKFSATTAIWVEREIEISVLTNRLHSNTIPISNLS